MTETNAFLNGGRSSVEVVNENAEAHGWDIEEAAEAITEFLQEMGMGEQIAEKIADAGTTLIDTFELVDEFEAFCIERMEEEYDPDADGKVDPE